MSGNRPPDTTGQLTVSWIPGWYELDQTVVVGQRDFFYFYHQDQIPVVGGQRFFYFQKDGTRPLATEGVVPQELVFANGRYDSDFEVRATITRIYNSVFGEIRGILADGLDYRVVTADGRAFKVEAEEDPGLVYALGRHLQDQHFIVHLADVERTGETSSSRRGATSRDTQLEEDKKRWARVQALIEPFELVESVENEGTAEGSHDQPRPRPARQMKDDETIEIGVAASGFSNVTTFSLPKRLRLGLLLTFRYGFLRWGRWIPAVAGDAIYPDFIRPGKRIHAGWDDWVGYYLLAGNEESDVFLRRFYSRHCSPADRR